MTLGHLTRPDRHRAAPICRATTLPRLTTSDGPRIRPVGSSSETSLPLPCPFQRPLKLAIPTAPGSHFP